MRFGVITLLPEMFQALEAGVVGKAFVSGLATLSLYNPRDFAVDKYKTVDDSPYGGGAGMVMSPEPLSKAILAAKKDAVSADNPKVVYLSPQGRKFSHKDIADILLAQNIVLVAGRYEGIDERVIDKYVNEEWSIGDYVLSGGELGAMVIIDAVVRQIPGVLGNNKSVVEDSLTSGLLKYPQYTRPKVFEDSEVPGILASGNHEAIARWRLKHALGRTWQRRPDLLAKLKLSADEKKLLEEFIDECTSYEN